MSYYTHINGKYTEVKNFDDILDNLRYLHEDQEHRIQQLEEQNKYLKDEHYKDNELQAMKNTVENLCKEIRLGFPVSEEEDLRLRDWQYSHMVNHHHDMRYKKIASPNYSYSFSITPLGAVGYTYCEQCSELVRRQLYKELIQAEMNADSYDFTKRREELNKEYDARFCFRDLQ